MPKTELQNKWEKQVTAFHESGMSAAKFCEANGLVEHQLWYWIGKFRKEKRKPTQSAQWVPVKVDEPITLHSDKPLIVKIGEAKIEVRAGFDPELLSAVVKTLSVR